MATCNTCLGDGVVERESYTDHEGSRYNREYHSDDVPCPTCDGRGHDEDGPSDSIKGKLLHPVTANSGEIFPKGTIVYTLDGDGDVEELMKLLMWEQGFAVWLLPNLEERRLEPDVVDFGYGA